MSEVWTFGETMVSLRASSTVGPGTGWTTHVAGAESNVAIGLARLGHSVTWCSRLGDDNFGHLVLRELRAEGISVDCELDPRRPTGFMFLSPTSFGAAVDYHREGSAASALTSDVTASLEAAQPQLVVISGITPALGTGPAAAAFRVAETARGMGATVVLDVNFRARLWSRAEAAALLGKLVRSVDVVVGSQDELELITSTPEQLLTLGPSQIVLKLGAEGARLHTIEAVTPGPTTPVTVQDPVGAGDAFTAGYISALLEGLSPEARLRRANLMGSAAVRHWGDYEGLPRRPDLHSAESMNPSDVTR